MASIRISIGRKASARGFKIDYRVDGNLLYVRKGDEPITKGESKKKREKVAQEA